MNHTRGARGDLKLPHMLRLSGEAEEHASDTLADSRVQKPKNFLAFSSRLRPYGDRGAPISVFCPSSNVYEPHTTAYA